MADIIFPNGITLAQLIAGSAFWPGGSEIYFQNGVKLSEVVAGTATDPGDSDKILFPDGIPTTLLDLLFTPYNIIAGKDSQTAQSFGFYNYGTCTNTWARGLATGRLRAYFEFDITGKDLAGHTIAFWYYVGGATSTGIEIRRLTEQFNEGPYCSVDSSSDPTLISWAYAPNTTNTNMVSYTAGTGTGWQWVDISNLAIDADANNYLGIEMLATSNNLGLSINTKEGANAPYIRVTG